MSKPKTDKYAVYREYQKGKTVNELANLFGVTERTIFASLRKVKEEQKKPKTKKPKVKLCDEGAKNLAVAIITLTANDYKTAVQRHGDLTTFRRFFHSEWFELLASIVSDQDIDPDKVIFGIESRTNTKKSKQNDVRTEQYWQNWKESRRRNLNARREISTEQKSK